MGRRYPISHVLKPFGWIIKSYFSYFLIFFYLLFFFFFFLISDEWLHKFLPPFCHLLNIIFNSTLFMYFLVGIKDIYKLYLKNYNPNQNKRPSLTEIWKMRKHNYAFIAFYWIYSSSSSSSLRMMILYFISMLLSIVIRMYAKYKDIFVLNT